jgi:hypothetical protein
MKAVVSETPGPADLLKVAGDRDARRPRRRRLGPGPRASINPVDLFSLTPVRHFMRRVAARGNLQPEVIGHGAVVMHA